MTDISQVTTKPFINPYVAVIVGVFAVSFSALFVRLSTAPPLIIAAYRLLFTFLLILPVGAAGSFRWVRSMSRRETALSAVSGIFLALHFVTWFTSLKYTSVASSVVIVTTQPVFVLLGSWLFFREKVPRLSLVGGALALLGSVIVGAGDFRVGGTALLGDLLAFVAAIMVSGYMLVGRRLRGSVELSGYTLVTYGSASAVLVAASLLARQPMYPYPLRDWVLFAALALVCTILGHTVFNWVLRYVQASVVSVSVLGEPLGAIVWASIFLGESPTVRQLIGGGVIFCGLYLFTRAAAGSERAAGQER